VQQQSLIIETPAEALREVIRALGGTKAIAPTLWPELSIECAHRRLLDCLNDDRRDKLSFEQVLLLLRLGRQGNCHAAMTFICRECGYSDPLPIEPADERAQLERDFIAAVKHQAALLARMERLTAPVTSVGQAPTLRPVG
jgi:hypothetical protein